jgi:SAM-dependent methyltransferase
VPEAASKAFWDELHRLGKPEYRLDKVLFRDIFARIVRPGMSCFEVGCYPGRYMVYLAREHGCHVSGIDYTSEFERMWALFREWQVRPLDLYQGDFLAFNPSKQYDFVYSLGFVEHFSELDEVLARHVRLVRPGGWLFIAAPNFRRVQYVLRRWLDPADLDRHCLATMDLGWWRQILTRLGMRVVFDGYYKTFGFWVSTQPSSCMGRRIVRFLKGFGEWVSARVDLPNRWTSPYLISVSQKV